MSVYSENYKKTLDGYTKIMKIIDSIEYADHLDCIPNLVDSWVSLVDSYCSDIYHDRTSKTRKTDIDHLDFARKDMFDNIKNAYQSKLQSFSSDEYEGNFGAIRVKGLQEIVNEV